MTTAPSANTSPTFSTLSGADCTRLIASARREENVAWRQIREKLNMGNTPRTDALCREIASQEESQLRVPSDFLKGRVAMYRRALAGVATISRGDGSVQPESRQG